MTCDPAEARLISSCLRTNVGRRGALAGAVGLCAGLWNLRAPAQIAPEATRARPQPGDLLVRTDDDGRQPLSVPDVPLGENPIMAWPLDPVNEMLRSGSRLNKILLLRLDPERLEPQTREYAVEGVIAYSAICPHTGCEVSTWHAEPQILECPCHFSKYDPKAGAKVLSGPSPRRLAALPLLMKDGGRLVVAQPFIGRVGFQQQL